MERIGIGEAFAVRIMLELFVIEVLRDVDLLLCPLSRAKGRDREADRLPAARARNVPPPPM